MHFTVSRNQILKDSQSNDIIPTRATAAHTISNNNNYASTPAKAYQSTVSPVKGGGLRDGSTGGLFDNFMTQQQEDDLEIMLKKMNEKDREYGKHYQTIKKSWLVWGKNQSSKQQRVVQVQERAKYGSNFQNLGANTQM